MVVCRHVPPYSTHTVMGIESGTLWGFLLTDTASPDKRLLLIFFIKNPPSPCKNIVSLLALLESIMKGESPLE